MRTLLAALVVLASRRLGRRSDSWRRPGWVQLVATDFTHPQSRRGLVSDRYRQADLCRTAPGPRHRCPDPRWLATGATSSGRPGPTITWVVAARTVRHAQRRTRIAVDRISVPRAPL